MARKKWQVAEYDKELAAQLSESCDLDPFAALLLVSRGIRSAEEAEAFFSDETEMTDPFLIKDMDIAVYRIQKALEKGERIAVYGDYDADGVTATALLYSYLESQEADVIYYVPDREKEGYGLHTEAIDKLKEDDVKLIITVDTGISAVEEAKYISSLGMELIITDHHQVGDVLPEAVAVIDPHRHDCPSTFKDWAGVGVAFKLISALEGCLGDELLEDYGDLVTIGTVADVVPLVGENRRIVKSGLSVIESGDRPGVGALANIAGIYGKELTATRLAFTFCPRMNAAGRMGSAMRAIHLLLEEDNEVALQLAEELNCTNIDRQEAEQEILRQAEEQISANPAMRYDRILVVAGENWHGGVIGIVAARLLEKYGKPTLVLSIDGDRAKGSGRSIEGFSLFEALKNCSDVLTAFGGHTMAAGFSLESSKINEFRRKINEYAAAEGEMPFLTVNLDCRLNPAYINVELLDTLSRLEPFGAGNPQPMFCLTNMEITQINPVGGGKHLRLMLSRRGSSVKAMKFGVTAAEFPYRVGDIVDLAVRLDKNEYNGSVSVSVLVSEIRLSGQNEDELLKTQRLYEKYKRGEHLTASEADKALPSREMMAETYRFLRAKGGWNHGAEMLCCRLKTAESNFCRTKIALDAMKELGLIYRDEAGFLRLPKQTQKVQLQNSHILHSLQEIKEGAV